ncbi:MAG: ribonuclease HII [Phascolarctobacterium sp.]|nr:ribonuclease HII [Phascolarctobacterium sp.]
MKINGIKELLNGNPTSDQLVAMEQDERTGVKKLLAVYRKRLEKEAVERERFDGMLRYERQYYAYGAKYIAGVDEAGRGPLAGPLVIAAVILPRDIFIECLNDSKQLSAKKREALYWEIVEKAIDISVNVVSVSNIDKLNIYKATQLGMEEVIAHLRTIPSVALIDAMPVRAKTAKTVSIVHGDALSASIAAASVIAKVTRDRIMEMLALLHPEYNFSGNKGYGSKDHMQAIKDHGATPWHRRSFEPVRGINLPAVEERENILYSSRMVNGLNS